MKKILALLLILVMGISLTACSGSQDSPESVLEAWEKAHNERDAKLLHEISEDGIYGKTVSDYENLLNKKELIYGEDYKVEVEVKNIEKESSDRAEADVKVTITSDRIGREVEEDNVGLKKVDGKWYIID